MSGSKDALQQVARLKELLTARATGKHQPDDGKEYTVLRHDLLEDPQIANRLPEFVRSHRTTDEF